MRSILSRAALAFATASTSMAAAQPAPVAPNADTLHLEVGSPQVNGLIYEPHTARVRVRVGPDSGVLVSEWTNDLTLGDSAGRRVARWVTKGTQYLPTGGSTLWEIRQTFDAVTLAPLGYARTSSNGARWNLRIDGTRVEGTRRGPGDTAVTVPIEYVLDRPGFVASASDLVPLAVGLKAGTVMTAPLWGPAMTRTERRAFTVVGRKTVDVEGTPTTAWAVEEHRLSDRALMATWYLTEESPYMVYGEVPMPNGQVRRMTEVAIPRPSGGMP